MSGDRRVALVTGASSGIGKQVAKMLAAQGWRVIGTGRDPGRMAAAEDEVGQVAANGGRFEMLSADLSLIAGARKLAAAVAERTDRLDLLVNNAGGITDRLVMTAEGLEANFAGNHLGPMALTQALLPLLRKAAEGAPAGTVRVLMTSSDTSEMLPAINLDDIQNLANFDPGISYCAGKLANVLFAKGLAERLKDSGIAVHAMAPGPVATNFYATASAQTREHVKDLAMFSEAEGADTLVWLVTAEEAGRESGGYWEQRKPKPPNPLANDAQLVERFWQESEKLVRSAAL
jgi:NAD(P)-dependent dehydrogenase (short-subunit alcohol dehydrogenase family)